MTVRNPQNLDLRPGEADAGGAPRAHFSADCSQIPDFSLGSGKAPSCPGTTHVPHFTQHLLWVSPLSSAALTHTLTLPVPHAGEVPTACSWACQLASCCQPFPFQWSYLPSIYPNPSSSG